ncbi:hypothetical protein DL96DRAFT_1101935 [Flagelloscypha sp. PMI_526]|nr:hypothetical protein DL96DRAFT_1101935 [Flagelloscypha sp. PMI_526]
MSAASSMTLLRNTLDSIISSIENPLTDTILSQLSVLLPTNMITAAFDLLDRDQVTVETTRHGQKLYTVMGSTSVSFVTLDLPDSSAVPVYCTCPAFAFTVLLTESHIMCKHVLAARLHRQMISTTKVLSIDDLRARLRILYPDVGSSI